MSTALRYGTDSNGQPNGLLLPFDEADYATYTVLAEIAIAVPVATPPERPFNRVVFNAANPSALYVSYAIGKTVPAVGMSTVGLVVQPGVLMLQDQTTIYIQSAVEQAVTVLFYNDGLLG